MSSLRMKEKIGNISPTPQSPPPIPQMINNQLHNNQLHNSNIIVNNIDNDDIERITRKFDKIESLEQELIQHIHTAGLRKPREIALCEEIMIIRKERRQVYTSLNNNIKQLIDNINILSSRLNTMNNNNDILTSQKVFLLQQKYDDLNTTANDKIEYLKNQIKKIQDNQEFVISNEKELLRQRYEKKMKLLDDKYNELSDSKHRRDTQIAEGLAADIILEKTNIIETEARGKIDKYKNIIRTLVEKEKDQEVVIIRLENKNKTLDHENHMLRQHIQSMQENVNTKDIFIKDCQSKVKELLTALNRSKDENEDIVIKLQTTKKEYEKRIIELQESHANELNQVDLKVRKALLLRDETIKEYKTKLSEAEQKFLETEEVLSSINNDISDKRNEDRRIKTNKY